MEIVKRQQLNWTFIEQRFTESETISPAFVAELRNIFLGINTFEEKNFEAFSLEEIYAYLKCSHSVYLDLSLPKIENTLHQLCARSEKKSVSLHILLLFIEKYKKQLVNHIEHEERVLFQFVEELLNGNYSEKNKNFVMTHFLHTHNDNVILSLEELKKDLLSLDEELKTNLAFRILFDQLTCFQEDLMVHGLIEDHVFIQKIMEYIQIVHTPAHLSTE